MTFQEDTEPDSGLDHRSRTNKKSNTETLRKCITKYAALRFFWPFSPLPPWLRARHRLQTSDRAEARAKVRAACAADLQKFCANVERGKGAMRACLEEHQTNLSAECTAARAERAAARAKEKS